jgi:PAS domain S-box-containing protein
MSSVRILVVEDENIVALDLEQTLRRVGYEVVGISGSAQDAVRRASELRPDLVIMDVELRGGSDGIEAAAAIQGRFGIGIIFLTAYADEKTLQRAKAVQPLAYLLKPFNDQDLYTAIEVALDAQKRQEAERKETQEALLQSEERFRLLVDGVREYALYLLDPNGNIATWNSGAERIHGYTAEEILGHHYSSFFTEEDREAGTAMHGLAQAAIHGRWHTEGWRVRKDGSRFWSDGDITALRNQDGRLRGFAKIAHDITERKQFEDKRLELLEQEKGAREQAEHLNRIKDEFLQTLSHELRTPLTPILGWTLYMRSNGYNQAIVARAVDIIERNARAQISLIEDLLDVGRIVSGKLHLNLQRCLVDQTIEAAIEAVRPTAAHKEIDIQYVKQDPASLVMGDPVRLEQVVWNLLSNAVKFTPTQGKVDVVLSIDGPEAIIQVRDTGEGISPDFLPHLFSRFSQADSSTTRRHGGLGLGLSIVRHLVDLHGGAVSAHSRGRNQGATFTVRLPLASASVPFVMSRVGSQDVENSSHLLMGSRILVVDDQEDALDFFSVVLERAGAIPILAASAPEALATLDHDWPALILADIGMAGEDGYDLLRTIRKRNINVPVIAVTAFAREEDRHRALEEGFREHIAKPVEPDALISVIASVLKQRATA